MKTTKHLILPLIAVMGLLMATPAPVHAGDTGIYLAPRLMYNFQTFNEPKVKYSGGKEALNSSNRGSLGASLALGYNFYSRYFMPVRAEVELGYSFNASYSSVASHLRGGSYSFTDTIGTQTLFVNGYYDFYNTSQVTPYLSAGLGTSWLRSSGNIAGYSTGSNTEVSFAWNIGAGLGFKLSDTIGVDVGYRYANLGRAKTGLSSQGMIETNVASHQLMMGLRYNF